MMTKGKRRLLAVSALLLASRSTIVMAQGTLRERQMDAAEEVAPPRELSQGQMWPAIGDRWVYADVGDGNELTWHKIVVFRVGEKIAGNGRERRELLKECALWTWPMGGPDFTKWTLVGPDLPLTRGQPLDEDKVGLLVLKRWWLFVRPVARVLSFLQDKGCSPTYSYFSLVRRDRKAPRP